jgi:hypothetical protein
MADPISLSAMSIGASAGGGILNAFSALGEGKSSKAMYGYQAQVARMNADIDRQNADWERTKGEIEAGQYGLKAAQQFGAIRTGQAASGLDVNSGSNAEVQASQRKLINIDNETIRANAAKAAYNYDVKAVMDENQAKLYDAAGANAEKASYFKAAGSIIGSVGSVSSKWLAGTQSGVFGSGTGPIKLFGPDQTVVGYA